MIDIIDIGILTIGIQSSYILLARRQKIESKAGCAGIFICNAAYKPIISTFRLTGYGNVISRFSFNLFAVVPIYGYIFDKLKCIHVHLVILH